MIASLTEVRRLNKKGNVIPLYLRIPADLDTPVGAYMKLSRRKKETFLLESIEGGEKLARYSFIGVDPFLTVSGYRDKVILFQGKNKKELDVRSDDFIRELFSFYKPVTITDLPRFTGGAVGYFAYDTIRWLERLPNENEDDIGLPEARFSLYKSVVAFDHLKQEIVIIVNVLHDDGDSGLNKKYADAKKQLLQLSNVLKGNVPKLDKATSSKSTVHADYTRAEFTSMVKKAKKYIKEGDIFQVVLSQRWRIQSEKSSLSVYRNLRRLNPSPYMFHITFDDIAIIGSSPEMLARIEGKTIETRPIAGTRPRGKNDIEDQKQIADLLADKKELAEHTMLLDLGRNDIGRVAQPGTVLVDDNMIIEKYSHVIHIVSSVVGKILPQVKPLDGFLACFPAGTVSGAPKIRAMEIIDELEKYKRSVYAGAVAYLDFWGNIDSCIAIRTVVKKGNQYFVQAGAGIVADSKPVKEFRETEAKASVLVEAVTGSKH